MADEDITLDGKPLQSLRVADLKAALEQRNLPKSGQKNTLIKRLKGALMLENLQKSSSSNSGLQPNSQIGEEMCQNSFIKQYLAKQQELLRQRLEREAQQEEEADESPGGPEEDEDHSEDNENCSYVSDKHRTMLSQSSMAKPGFRGEESMIGHGSGPALQHQESAEAPGPRMQRGQGLKELPAPSPPRAVASLSVRVLGQPDCQGLPLAVPPTQEKEGTAPSELGSAPSVLHFSRSGRSSAGNHVRDESDEDDDDESDNDEDWGPAPGRARRRRKAAPPVLQMAPSVPLAAARSKRKLQPPQHIPPAQAHHAPLQLRHPTPPPSPPPNLFPLPDTPKQSPPDTDDQEGEAPVMQKQYSDSSSRSSSPEPPGQHRPGPLSLLIHKMESEEATVAPGMSRQAYQSTAGCSSESSSQGSESKRQQESRVKEEQRQLKEEKEREHQHELEVERRKIQEQERQRHLEKEKENERKQPEEEKQKKCLDGEKRREEKQLKGEQEKEQEKANKDRVVVSEAQDTGSSSESDSKSGSSSRSSQSSSSSSSDKTQPASQLKKQDQGKEVDDDKKTNFSKGLEKQYPSKREVSEPSTAAITEVEPDSESSMAEQPVSSAEPENSESRLEESTTPKAFAARKISLTSSKASPGATDGGGGESDTGNAAGRKRRWGSSTAVTAKKPSISITTESLKSLIPDIKVNQEAVVELHPEELQSSGEEENMDTSRGDPDKGLKIRRTVTQVVPSESQENGQTNEEEEPVEKKEKEKEQQASRDKRMNSLSEETSETQISVNVEGETKKVTSSDGLVRRSISQQKSGVSVTIDDPVRTTRQPSPPRGKISNIIHVKNLVRPFTLVQLKELLNRTGSIVEEGFWIDKIKSHCYVTYTTTEEAVATRTALHGVKWPPSNPKVLYVDFCEQDELDFHKGVLKPDRDENPPVPPPPPEAPQNRLPPLMPERDRDRDREREKERERDRERDRGVRDLWAERQREMERRERARGEREWDRDKIREFARPGEDGRRSRSRDRERRRRERAKSKEKKTDKKEKGDEPPAKMLDDLFLKTKTAPCIYWLPLTEEQAAQRLLDRTERQKERERRRKEREEEEVKKREEEKKERLKGREKDGTAVASGTTKRGGEGDRERDRVREREEDKRRDSSHRSRRPSPGAGRRSRSRSNPRDRRR